MSTAKPVTDADFSTTVLQSGRPVLVDFWAEWCGPCRQLSPIVEELAAEMAGRVDVVKMNIDESPDAPARYGIRGVPTLMLFKNGEVAATKVGALPKSKLVEWLEPLL